MATTIPTTPTATVQLIDVARLGGRGPLRPVPELDRRPVTTSTARGGRCGV